MLSSFAKTLAVVAIFLLSILVLKPRPILVFKSVLVLKFRNRFNSSSKPMPITLTIRVSQIPSATPAHQFLGSLEAFVKQRTQKDGKSIILWSFAPSAISSNKESECVATVTLQEIPPSFNIRGYINLKGEGLSLPILVDAHFFGLTPLSNPVNETTVEYELRF